MGDEHTVSRKEWRVMAERGSELHLTRDRSGASRRGPSRSPDRPEPPDG